MRPQDVKPPFWTKTHREFKEQKRKEFQAVIKAYEKFRLGCVYVPGYDHNIADVSRGLRNWEESMSVKNWGR